MKTLQRSIFGIMAAVISGLFVFGILSLAVVEGMITLPPTATIQATLQPPNLTPIAVIRLTTTLSFMQTSTPAPIPTQCPPPEGWLPYFVQPGDNLADLAALYGLSLEALMEANCLISSQLVMNASIYLPPPTATATVTSVRTPTACTRPPGWILYTIRPGDTLSIISRQFQISLQLLMQANCLTSEYIIAGNTLWVPNVPTVTPNTSPTATRTQVPPPPEPTWTPVPTSTWTFIPTSPPIPTPTIIPPSETYTHTPSETNTEIPTETPTPTVEVTGTESHRPPSKTP